MPPGRPRMREGDIRHGTDRGYRYCRAGSDGGRCDPCKDAHADAEARRAATRRGLSGPPPQPLSFDECAASVSVLPQPAAVVDPEPGPIEQGVLDEVKTLSAAERRPSAVQTAVRLARDLDDPRLATSHASMSRQLMAVMAALREASTHRQGRLASVAQMAQRTSSAGAVV